METIKRTTMIIVTFALIMCFLLSSTTDLADTLVTTKLVVSYGNQATQFASLIGNNTDLTAVHQIINRPAVIAISDMHEVSRTEINDALRSGVTIVAINLPASNGIADVPKVVKTYSTVSYVINKDNTMAIVNSTLPVTETETPSYVISVLCEKPVTWQQNFIVLNNSAVAQQSAIQQAVQSVAQALKLHTIKPNPITIEPTVQSDSTIMPLDVNQNNPYDTGSYYSQPTYTNDTTVDFGTGGGDHFTQNVDGAQLTNHDNQHEFYRFDVTTDHDLNADYQLWTGTWLGYFPVATVGPYMTSAVSYLQMDNNAYLEDYGPSTSNGATQASVNINLAYPSPSVGWGWTWSIPDAQYETDYSSTSVAWHENYAGPNYGSLAITPPPNCSHDSFRTTRSSLWQEPVYNGITVQNAYTTFNFQTDNVIWVGNIPNVNSNLYSYTIIPNTPYYCQSQTP